jgi:hypothetical protein
VPPAGAATNGPVIATEGDPTTSLQVSTGAWVTLPLATPGLPVAVPVSVHVFGAECPWLGAGFAEATPTVRTGIPISAEPATIPRTARRTVISSPSVVDGHERRM